MAAPRVSRLIALNQTHSGARQVRHMHTTGPATVAFRDVLNQSQRPTQSRSRLAQSDRQLTTTRSLQASGDDSFIDFAYLPTSYNDPEPISPELLRVPILPNAFTTKSNAESEDLEVMKPEISTMSADAIFSPMAENTDGHGLNIDFHAMADRVAANLKDLKIPADEQAGLMKQIWSDMVDDMMGKRKKGGS